MAELLLRKAILVRDRIVPGSQRELFEALASAELLQRDTALAMAQMASLRNRIARSYGDLDPVRMVREAPTGLSHVEKFIAELAGVLATPP